MSKKIIAVDSQKLNMVQVCPYKYQLTFNSNLIPVVKEAPFERGDLIHTMLETYYKMRKFRARWPLHFDQKRMKQTMAHVCDWKAAKLTLPMEEVEDNLRTMCDYVDYYWDEPFEALAVEQRGSKILHEDDDLIILYETKIDLIVRGKNFDVCPVDHKSSYRRGETIAISNQFMGYCWMLGSHNLIVNKVGFQKALKPSEKFTRPMMSYSTPVLEGWRQNSVWWIKRLLEHEESGHFPQNFTSCDDKYSGCIFRRICEAPPELRGGYAAEMFNKRDEDWDVGAEL